MQDVADLAKVRRPVVSMWRKRRSTRGVPAQFPSPVDVVGGVERFDSTAVVDYLQRTGRGNNPEAHLDAPAVAVPDGLEMEDAVTLLTWRALTGEDLVGTTWDGRVRSAAEHDPEDRLLLSEIRAMDPAPSLLEYVDDLVEASFGPSDALARLQNGRLKREVAARDLTSDAVDLVSRVISACAVHLGPDGVALTADRGMLPVRVATRAGLPLVSGDRSVRRRATINDVAIGGETPGPKVRLVSSLKGDLADVLDAADDTVLDLPIGQIAVIVGPAAALTDVLRGELQHRRAHILRVGNVLAALRLPRGLWREAYRQSLAVWVCRGGAQAGNPWAADLGAVEHLEPADLAADVVGALGGTEDRAYRYARRVDLTSVLVSGALVPRGVRATVLGVTDSQDHVDRVQAATLVTTAPLGGLDVLVRPSPGRLRVRRRSLGELRDAKVLSMKRGSRISGEGSTPDGTVVVLPTELSGGVSFDPIEAEQRFPRAMRTEPGDVVFVEKPRPRAWVDHRGGAMVASPARVLRLSPAAEIGPRLLAVIVNTQVAEGSEWQTWAVPVLSRADADRIESTLADVERYDAELRRRVDVVDELKTALIDGVAAGVLSLDAEPTTPGVTTAFTEKGS